MQNEAPLADRMRPQNLDEIIGQDHIIGEGTVTAPRYSGGTVLFLVHHFVRSTGHRQDNAGPGDLQSDQSSFLKASPRCWQGLATCVKVIAEATERRRLLPPADDPLH